MTVLDDTTLPPAPPAGADETPEQPRPSAADRRSRLELTLTIAVVAGAAVYTLFQLHPDLVLKDTTPAGGDMGAHVWGPAYLRDHILPHFRLSGWANDWYAGFPMYHFYMVVPALAVVVLDVLLPYGVALKLVSIAGIVALPVAAWAFGRLAGLRWPIPELFSWAAVFFLFDETFTIYGGNIASTMAGEFSFSIALSLSLFYLGVFTYGMRTGKHRALAAVLFALCALSHLIVAFFAIIGTVVMWLFWVDKKRTVYLLSVGIVGGLLTMFWILPFWYRGPYMTDMFYERRIDFSEMFFPQSAPIDFLLLGLAMIGFVGAVVRGYRAGAWLGVMALAYAVWARLWPQSHLWNARLLPFLYLLRYFLVAMGVVEVGRAIGRLIAPGSERADWRARVATLGAGSVVSLVLLGLHIQNLPFFEQRYDQADQRWEYSLRFAPAIGVASKPAFVDDWARWNYSGYEGKDAYGEYYGIVTTMEQLGQEQGCGRALWENNNEQDKYGTPMALMLLPFWTDGCIGSMEGLFFEAAGTTPYHFLSASALSERSSNPVRRLRFEDGEVDKGVEYLQQMGVRYYLAFSESIKAKADRNPDLTLVRRSGPWNVYEVAEWALVQPLDVQPVVVEGVDGSRDAWLEVGTSWFQERDRWPARPADEGPDLWQRVPVEIVPDSGGAQRPTDDRYLAEVQPGEPIETVELPPVTVSDVEVGDDRISFSVDQVGVPVVVRTSYFPNWKVSGADGPYRIAPNFMVIIPTDNEVSLHYGWTWVDLLAYFLTFVGIGGVIWLWRRGPLDYVHEVEPTPTEPPPPPPASEPDGFLLDWDEGDEPSGGPAPPDLVDDDELPWNARSGPYDQGLEPPPDEVLPPSRPSFAPPPPGEVPRPGPRGVDQPSD